eukprot:COSAG02_NODE_6311_length_3662_cov_3.062026_6_plen_88_part_00
MAGYVTTYNKPVGEPGSFLFTTVRGAGHMVPRYRPAEIFLAINFFFAPQVLPGYTRAPSVTHAKCRVTTDPNVAQATSHGGHDSWVP